MKLSDTTPDDIAPPKILQRLERTYGRPWSVNDKGIVTSVNPAWWAGLYHQVNNVIFSRDEGFFYFDEVEGIYLAVSIEVLRERIAHSILGAAKAHAILGLASQARMHTIKTAVQHLQGIAEIPSPFENSQGLLAVDNGVLVLSQGKVEFLRYAPRFHLRDRVQVAYDPKAACPRYDFEFLDTVLESIDANLLHRHAGLVLAGINPSHRLGILEGSSGAGKSTWLRLLTEILGVSRVVELRTEHLDKPFEMSAFRGKLLLSAADVGGDFLCTPGANTLKGLVSDDIFWPESKNSNDRRPLRGPFNAIVGTNCKLVYKSQGDGDAWRRRLIIYEWADPPKDRRRLIDLGSELLQKEGSGILNRFLDGYRQAWKELHETGDLVLSDVQKDKVEALVMRSEALETFVMSMVIPETGEDLSSDEFLEAFLTWCMARGWIPPSQRIIQLRVPDLILRHHGKTRSNDLKREGHTVRGWRGLKLLDDGSRAF